MDLSDRTGPRRVAQVAGHRDDVSGVALSADGRIFVTGSWDGTAQVWDLSHPPTPPAGRLQGHRDSLDAVALSADGRTVITSSTDVVRLWDTADLSVGRPVVR